ncbi:GNAT family N-acetyltransferase [Breoghania sp.]|uniref:GNAT family N-acetyltransferase n=1 Tax=Breoghania sp. TaxID=2065378 RepID=UPI0026112BD4|nr:GNAT family N-acetyltransferase [Breoghania sp.]MDJ0932553.1 GNAT family N-acetyltransferase [Breoghania sp.]
MATAPERRRRGLAAKLVTAALAHGGRSGAKKAWSQVVADNVPAKALYSRFGFKPLYSYHYFWMRPLV